MLRGENAQLLALVKKLANELPASIEKQIAKIINHQAVSNGRLATLEQRLKFSSSRLGTIKELFAMHALELERKQAQIVQVAPIAPVQTFKNASVELMNNREIDSLQNEHVFELINFKCRRVLLLQQLKSLSEKSQEEALLFTQQRKFSLFLIFQVVGTVRSELQNQIEVEKQASLELALNVKKLRLKIADQKTAIHEQEVKMNQLEKKLHNVSQEKSKLAHSLDQDRNFFTHETQRLEQQFAEVNEEYRNLRMIIEIAVSHSVKNFHEQASTASALKEEVKKLRNENLRMENDVRIAHGNKATLQLQVEAYEKIMQYQLTCMSKQSQPETFAHSQIAPSNVPVAPPEKVSIEARIANLAKLSANLISETI